jgi:cytochrome c oxidase subunit 3
MRQEAGSGSRLGMWLFIGTEILLFGGLFLLYAVYRARFSAEFHLASRELNRFDGTLNTGLLITSSFLLALGSAEFPAGRARRALLLLGATMLLGVAFLVVKGFEWGSKFRHGIYPSAPELLARSPGEILYIGLYFTMTGLHALHVIVGIGVLAGVAVLLARGRVTAERPILLENAGLYWHLVDVIWIFLFPLFYLIT